MPFASVFLIAPETLEPAEPVKVTELPDTGLPEASVTRTLGTGVTTAPTVLTKLVAPTAATVAAAPVWRWH